MRRFSTKVKYDPEMDSANWRGYNPIFAALNSPQWKKELRASNTSKRMRSISAARRPKIEERLKSEEQIAELVRQCVSALRFALTELQQVPRPSTNYHSPVNLKQLHNTIWSLRNKCGVSFPPDDDDNAFSKVDLDR